MGSATQRLDGWWSIEFEFDYNGQSFKDSIVLSPIDYINITDAAITEMQQQRFAAWIAAITPVEE